MTETFGLVRPGQVEVWFVVVVDADHDDDILGPGGNRGDGNRRHGAACPDVRASAATTRPVIHSDTPAFSAPKG